MWWNILKNAKIRGKGKTGGKLDTSRLKVNVEDNTCERDFNAWFSEQRDLNELAFTFPIEVELTQKVSRTGLKPKEAGIVATEKEYCELLDYLKQGLAGVLVSGLSMAIDNMVDKNESYYEYTPFESSKGNISILFVARRGRGIGLYVFLLFKDEDGLVAANMMQRSVGFKAKDYNDGKRHMDKYLRKVMFKW